MKILIPGNIQKTKYVCPNCGCVFLADENEIYCEYYLECPQEGCKRIIDIRENQK